MQLDKMITKTDMRTIPVKEGLWTTPIGSDVPRLIGSRCISCGELYFPKKERGICIHCGQTTLNDVTLSRKGKVSSFTVVMRPPAGGYYKGPVPFAYGTVDLPEGLRLLTLLTGRNLDELKVGMEVELVIEKLCDDGRGNEVITYKFRPIET